MWTAIGLKSLSVGVVAFCTTVAGLIVGIVRKRWRLLKWSSMTLGVCFIFLMIAVAADTDSEPASTTPTVAPSVEALRHSARKPAYNDFFRNNEDFSQGNRFTSRAKAYR